MTDNGSAYRSRRFRKALRWLNIRHIFTRPYTPKTNGKAERFIQTLLREWAYGLAHPSSNARNADLTRWLDWFNKSRQHSALNGLPPLSAVNNLVRNHTHADLARRFRSFGRVRNDREPRSAQQRGRLGLDA